MYVFVLMALFDFLFFVLCGSVKKYFHFIFCSFFCF